MSLVTKPKSLTNGTVAQATDVESNFSTIYNDYNGNIDNTNLAASASIADTKLSQITTYNKVSGAAIGSLASISSAAGVIPAVNIPLLAGLSTASVGSIPYAAADTSLSALATGVSGTFLMSTGTTAIPAFSKPTQRLLGIDCGTSTGIAANGTATVTFNFTFSAAPVIVCSTKFGSGQSSALTVITKSGSGCTIYNLNGNTVDIDWIAIGTPA